MIRSNVAKPTYLIIPPAVLKPVMNHPNCCANASNVEPRAAPPIKPATQTTQKIQVSFGEKALEYVDYIFPQVCTVKVGENIGWESLKIKSDRMYLYTSSQCVISADYYTNKYVIDKDERLKYVSCGDSFTEGDFTGLSSEEKENCKDK